ncbi:peptidylprolyl isomerase [Parvularcula lutaonensis]|uniref:Parvulin-like PPIase n=1 Tax=Parvularcula lutaonensis TaxID=491923 RepID=A0ABV7MBX5_9PROT|nr:peptidylprolyl isomerase [Parvularcula lutaonensis]GGY49473.1 peptidylprolyl isomerase [Parvularcula lutaonensis]
MLKFFRGMLEGPGRWIFIILLVAAFGVFGVPALENFGGSAAIKVGSQEISAQEVEQEFSTRLRQVQAQNPNVTREQALAQGLDQQVIEILTAQALLEEEARRLGLAVPDSVVQQYIEQIDGLADPSTGRFDRQRLGLYLQSAGLTLPGFRDQIAAEILRLQLADAVAQPVAAPEELTRLLILRQFENRQVQVATVPADAAEAEPTEEEIEASYQADIESYQTPEFRTLTVLTIDESAVTDSIDVSDEEIEQLFNVRAGALAAGETRSIRQILVPQAQADGAAAAAEGGIDAIQQATGGTVTVLEDQRQSDFINEELGEAVFAAEEGALVGPIATGFGVVYAEVTDVKEAQGPSLEDLRDELEAELRAEIADRRILELVEGVEEARDTGASLAEAAEAVGLEARTEGPVDRELFTRFGSIANIPQELGREGFLLSEGEESPPIRLNDGYGFVAVEDITPPQPIPLSEVRDQVVAKLEAEKRASAADEILARFQAGMAEGKTFSAVAEELGATVQTETVSLIDQEPKLPQPVLAKAFDLAIGELGSVPVEGEPAVQVIEVTNVSYADSSAVQPVLPQLSAQFGQQIAGELNQAYLFAIEEDVEVKQNPSQIARAFGRDQP